jgi:hypothetical protein
MSHSYSSNCVHAVYSINDRRNLIVRSQTCVRVREAPRLRRYTRYYARNLATHKWCESSLVGFAE